MIVSRELFNASEARRDTVAQDAENATRPATQSVTHETTGMGYFVANQVTPFDVTFIEEPAIASGVSIVKAPDARFWNFPLVTAGVFRWRREVRTGYYTGAYLYFAVICEQLTSAATNATKVSELITLRSQYQAELARLLAGQSTPHNQATLDGLIFDLNHQIATFGGVANVNDIPPAKPVLTHHLTFNGTATKDLPRTVTDDLHAESPIRLVTYGSTS